MGNTDKISASFPLLHLSQTCLQSGWDESGNRGIQDLPARSRDMSSTMGKSVKPPTFILSEKGGLSSKRGRCLMEEAGAWDGGQGKKRLGRDFRLLFWSDGRGWDDLVTL